MGSAAEVLPCSGTPPRPNNREAPVLAPQVLLGLGSHVRTLKLEGRMSTLALAGSPSWSTLLPLLFRKLPSLQAFEAYINAVDLIEAAEAAQARPPHLTTLLEPRQNTWQNPFPLLKMT